MNFKAFNAAGILNNNQDQLDKQSQNTVVSGNAGAVSSSVGSSNDQDDFDIEPQDAVQFSDEVNSNGQDDVEADPEDVSQPSGNQSSDDSSNDSAQPEEQPQKKADPVADRAVGRLNRTPGRDFIHEPNKKYDWNLGSYDALYPYIPFQKKIGSRLPLPSKTEGRYLIIYDPSNDGQWMKCTMADIEEACNEIENNREAGIPNSQYVDENNPEYLKAFFKWGPEIDGSFILHAYSTLAGLLEMNGERALARKIEQALREEKAKRTNFKQSGSSRQDMMRDLGERLGQKMTKYYNVSADKLPQEIKDKYPNKFKKLGRLQAESKFMKIWKTIIED